VSRSRDLTTDSLLRLTQESVVPFWGIYDAMNLEILLVLPTPMLGLENGVRSLGFLLCSADSLNILQFT
jgi:hypothetical protein